jgi:hypothetical protein
VASTSSMTRSCTSKSRPWKESCENIAEFGLSPQFDAKLRRATAVRKQTT